MKSDKLSQILSSLNPAQLQAATHEGGPLLVMAGPGTGKTRVLMSRIAWILAKGRARPEQILAITFTNQAADEIAQRIKGACEEGLPQVSTFHSWAFRLLRSLGAPEGYLHPIDEEMAKDLFKECALGFGHKAREASELFKTLSRLRQNWPLDLEGAPALETLYEAYRARMRSLGVCDFDEIILDGVRLLNDARIRQQLHDSLSWIMVDEFQDISRAQYELLKLAAGTDPNITFIGDPCQSIYSFRGAEPELVNVVKQDFPEIRTIWLETCYRCPQTILDAAGTILDKGGTHPRPPVLLSQKGNGAKVAVKACRDEHTEARWIARTIEGLIGGLSFDSINFGKATGETTRSFNEIAILYRLNGLGDVIEKELELSGIPVKRPGKALRSTSSSIKKLNHLWEIIHNRNRLFHLEMLKPQVEESLVSEEALNRLERLKPESSTKELLLRLAEYLKIETDSPIFQGLMKRVEHHSHLPSLSILFKDEADLLDVDLERVSLLTLHGAKGLEFPIIFLAGCEKELVPWKENPFLDEERRLFYVGMTRAMERLYISYARSRALWGKRGRKEPSPFLREIPDSMLLHLKAGRPKKQKTRAKQLTLFG